MTDLGPDARLLCIHEGGALVWGKAPPAETYYSAEFLTSCATYGDLSKRGNRK